MLLVSSKWGYWTVIERLLNGYWLPESFPSHKSGNSLHDKQWRNPKTEIQHKTRVCWRGFMKGGGDETAQNWVCNDQRKFRIDMNRHFRGMEDLKLWRAEKRPEYRRLASREALRIERGESNGTEWNRMESNPIKPIAIYHSIQSIHLSIYQFFNLSTNQSINRSINVNQSVSQSISLSVNQRISQSVDQIIHPSSLCLSCSIHAAHMQHTCSTHAAYMQHTCSIHKHPCMHPCIHKYIHTVTYGYIRLHTVTYGYIRLHTVTYGYIRLHATCGYIRLRTATCMHACMHPSIHPDIQTDRHTDIHTDIQINIQINIQTYRHADI